MKPGINAYSCPRPWTARPIRPSEPEGLWMVECPSNVGGKQQLVAYDLTKEDALVVAASPDLFEALDSCRDWLVSVGADGAPLQKTLAALARARGES